MEIADLVTTGIPFDAVLSGEQLIEPLDPSSLNSAKLIDRAALRRRFAEPHREHFSDHSEARILIERQASLIQEPIGAGATGLARGVQPDTGFPDPYDQTSDTRRQRRGSVGNSSTRLQHQACETADRDLRTNTSLVDNHERAVENIELTLLDEQNRRAVLERDRLWRREARYRSRHRLSPADQHQPAAKGLGRPETSRNCRNEGNRIGHGQAAVEIDRMERIGRPLRRGTSAAM